MSSKPPTTEKCHGEWVNKPRPKEQEVNDAVAETMDANSFIHIIETDVAL